MSVEKIGRNDPCPCGSGLKYKKCCYLKADAPGKRESVQTAADAASAASEEHPETPQKQEASVDKQKSSPRTASFLKGSVNTRPQKLHRSSQRGR